MSVLCTVASGGGQDGAATAALLSRLEDLRVVAMEMARQAIYLDPHSNAPDIETRMYCSSCGRYGDPGCLFFHKSTCPVGKALVLCCVRPDSYIEYDLGDGVTVLSSHARAAMASSHAALWGAR